MNAYILNKKPEDIINNTFVALQDSFKVALDKEYFQGIKVDANRENIEDLSKTVITIVSMFAASEIKRISRCQGINKNKAREMFYICIEKFLQDL